MKIHDAILLSQYEVAWSKTFELSDGRRCNVTVDSGVNGDKLAALWGDKYTGFQWRDLTPQELARVLRLEDWKPCFRLSALEALARCAE